MADYLNRTFVSIWVIFLTLFLVGCTCLPFSSPSSKTPVIGALSYSNIITYIETDTYGNPEWDGWNGVGDSHLTLSYSISPASENIEIDKSTGEITVLANKLFSNTYTVTVSGYGDFQENVSATLTIEVIPPFLHNVANVSDDSILDYGIRPLTVTKLGGTNYLFAGSHDDGISVFSMESDESLVNVDSVSGSESLEVTRPYSTALAQVGETGYLFATEYEYGNVKVLSVGNDGSLVNVAGVSDDDTLELEGAISIATAKVGEINYLFVAGYLDHGVSVFSVGNDGSLNNVDNVGNDNILKLSNVISITAAKVGGATYLFAVGKSDSGLSVFSVEDDGTLVNVTNVSDDDSLNLRQSDRVATVEVAGNTFLFVSGELDDGFSIFSVGSGGILVNVDNINDDNILELKRINSMTAAEVEGMTYLFVEGYFDQGVSTFSIDDSGTPVNVDNTSYDDILVKYAYAITTMEVEKKNYLIVVGLGELLNGGISVFSINPQSLVKMKKYRCSIQGVC